MPCGVCHYCMRRQSRRYGMSIFSWIFHEIKAALHRKNLVNFRPKTWFFAQKASATAIFMRAHDVMQRLNQSHLCLLNILNKTMLFISEVCDAPAYLRRNDDAVSVSRCRLIHFHAAARNSRHHSTSIDRRRFFSWTQNFIPKPWNADPPFFSVRCDS